MNSASLPLRWDVEAQAAVRRFLGMDEPTDAFEKAARIIEAYAEAEDDARVLELLADIARDIRAHLAND